MTKNKRRRAKPSKRAPTSPNRQTTLLIKTHKSTFFLKLPYDDYATIFSKIHHSSTSSPKTKPAATDRAIARAALCFYPSPRVSPSSDNT